MRARICLHWESCCSKWRPGRAPFQGDTAAAVFDHLLNRPPTSAAHLEPDAAAIARGHHRQGPREGPGSTLSRRRASSCGICEPWPTRLLAVREPPATSTERRLSSSIAVLPFVDMSPGKDQEYFCHGIAEEIINALTRVPGNARDLADVGVRLSGQASRGHRDRQEVTGRQRFSRAACARQAIACAITAQLVNADDGYQIWSKRFDRQLSDVFAIQDDIAAGILDEFRIRRDTPPTSPSLNVPAHDAYLKGMYALNKWTDGDGAAGYRRLP